MTQEELLTSFNSNGITFIPVLPDSDSDWQPKEATQIIGPQSFSLTDIPVVPGRAGASSKSQVAEYVWVCFWYASGPFDLRRHKLFIMWIKLEGAAGLLYMTLYPFNVMTLQLLIKPQKCLLYAVNEI